MSSMADKLPELGSESKLTYMGIAYPDGWRDSYSVMIMYSYHGAQFHVLVSSQADELPQGYDLDSSIEGKIITEIDELSYGTPTDDKDKVIDTLKAKLADLASVVCLPLIQEMAPPSPLPEPRTLEEQLYPPAHMLQILTENGELTARQSNCKPPEDYPPLSEEQIQDIALDITKTPVYDASNVVLISRVQTLVWKVKVDEEVMICKVSMHHFYGPTLANELEVYQKIGHLGGELKMPQFKGIVKSDAGVIAILLGYIPHKHHNLAVVLRDVKEGRLPKTEASPAMRSKWAEQIKHSVSRLHELGILWRDVKTDNVLIDDEGDAIVLDFGAGNTVGWVDADKYGTLEGDMQGLEKIIKALEED